MLITNFKYCLFSIGKPRPLGGVRVLWLCPKNILEIAENSLLKFPYLKQKPYWGNHFWVPGYCVDTVGLDAEMIRKHVKYQEDKERREEQLKLKI
jgi:REP element-mobilizing transposase RayT